MKNIKAKKLVRNLLIRRGQTYTRESALGITSPTDDGVQFVDPYKAIEEGKFDKDVPIIIGTSRDENALFMMFSFPILGPTEEVYRAFVNVGYADHAPEILDTYALSKFESPYWAMTELTTDIRWQCPVRRYEAPEHLLYTNNAHANFRLSQVDSFAVKIVSRKG
jgi:carboxylesterase type B